MMSPTRHGCGDHEISNSISARSLSEISETDTLRLGIDLVSAARRNIGFLRAVGVSYWLHQRATLVEAVRRYDELWMPLVADLTVGHSKPAMVLPPLDVEWVWFCHTLNPTVQGSYREYCEARFSKLIGKPAIFDDENKEYALMRCEEIWTRRYPDESFENEAIGNSELEDEVVESNGDLLNEIEKQRLVCSKFSWPYMGEIVYLIAARQRYEGFLFVLQKFSDGCSRLVPSLDILLTWMTHQSYPTVYAEDLKEMEADMGRVVCPWETAKAKEVDFTQKLWERVFNQPYVKAGGAIEFAGVASVKPPIYWEVSDTDVNTKYKSLLPRFLVEVGLFVRLNAGVKAGQENMKHNYLRLRMVRCHRELKIDIPISSFSSDTWKKAAHLYCEFSTKGLVIECRRHGSGCFKTSIPEGTATFPWNDLLRAPSLTMERGLDKQVRLVTSLTPPVQAPYLLKCVPDKVTDDSGAMISDVILRLSHYKPQEGRWLSRTVLDHAGRECFVVRMRVGGGFWRRGGETPSAVKWEDRIIEIREGSWSYIAASIGRAPEKVVGTATPKEPHDHWQAAWQFSAGEELLISWDSPALISDLRFCLRNQTGPDSSLQLLKGRQMQYRGRKTSVEHKGQEKQNKGEMKEYTDEENDHGFVTLVRFTENNLTGKATALINWKLLIVELMPEEDAVFVLLLCTSILRSVSEMSKEDVGSLLIRRRIKEAKLGSRDWGSVILHPSSFSSSIASPYLQPWYWNADAVVASDRGDSVSRQPSLRYSQVEGSDGLFKRGIVS